jgi:glycosyltransferase involved in cell wall biosynthesis
MTDSNNIFHTIIEPISNNASRPVWSIIIPTYNCAGYLKEALDSVLTNDFNNDTFEIIVVDDCSTLDNPENVVKQFNDSRIQFIRQPQNVGKVNNYAVGLTLSKGIFIHILHGDDFVTRGFYNELKSLFVQFPNIGAAFCQSNYVNEKSDVIGRTGIEIQTSGILEEWIYKITINQRIQPPSIAIKREVYENIGGYDYRLKYMEDWEFYIRVANNYPVAYTPKILANYRVHQNSSSQTSVLKGGRLTTLKSLLNIVDKYISPTIIRKIKKQRNQAQAYNLIRNIPNVLKNRDTEGYIRILIAILGFSIHPRIFYHIWLYSFYYKKYICL